MNSGARFLRVGTLVQNITFVRYLSILRLHHRTMGVKPNPSITRTNYPPSLMTATQIISRNITAVHSKSVDRKRHRRTEHDQLPPEQDDPDMFGTLPTRKSVHTVKDVRNIPVHSKSVEEIMRSMGSDQLPRGQANPDMFGTLVIGNSGLGVKDEIGVIASAQLRDLAGDAESIFAADEADDIVFKPAHRWTVDRLRRTVFQLLRENKLQAALDTFMEAIQDGGFPIRQNEISFICSALIYSCAKAGNVEMAFHLFDKMKQRGAGIKEAWYTSLLNACANSPWDSERNLQRIEKVRSHMTYKGYQLNQAHYHALIKAYGRCGAIQSAFAVVDEMRLRISTDTDGSAPRVTCETFNFLLQSCISDTDNGYRHAVVTWEKMLKMKMKPDFHSYNLFLRAIRECSIQLPKVKDQNRKLGYNATGVLPVSKGGLPEVINPAPGSLKENVQVMDLLSTNDQDGLRTMTQDTFPLVGRTNLELQQLLNVPENRFALLGGMRAFVTQMDIHKVRLDIKSATELVQNVSTAEVPDVLMMLESKNLKPDIHFFNMVMKKYMRWRQVEKAKKVLELLANYNLSPNIMTWGILALGAETWTDCSVLLREMDSLGVTPNDQILSGFLLNACKGYDPRYIVRLLELHVRRDLKASLEFVNAVKKFQKYGRQAIIDVECGREVKPYRLNSIVKTREFTEYFEKLKLRFDGWVLQVGVKEKEVPWKEDTAERIERLKQRKYQPSTHHE